VAKKIIQKIKLQIPGGQATPAPPVGTALGPAQINIMEFCKAFNDRTQKEHGTIIPVVITVFADRSFSFVTKTPPVSRLLLKEAKIEKGSGEPNKEKKGRVTSDQVRAIAEAKLSDLNTTDLVAAMRTVAGTARSMGSEIVD